MTTFSKGLMIALSLCLLLALNASFAQEDSWETVAVYMVDPIDEKVSLGVREYVENLTWQTFKRDFTPAREAQLAQVEAENEARIRSAARFLEDDLSSRGDGTSMWYPGMWYPAWIPLALAATTEDSLFKNILEIEGRMYSAGPRAGERQTLREFFLMEGDEPDGLNADGSQRFRSCSSSRPHCRKENQAYFGGLIEIHDQSLVSVTAPRIISLTVRARTSYVEVEDELAEKGRVVLLNAEFDYDSIRLLQPAVMNPDESVIDLAPYWKPAAKATASAKASSWGRIKATFADD